MLTAFQRDRIEVVLVSPRNPLNIGAVARAMANFGFADLSVVSAYEPHWREARSAVGAPELLANASEHSTLESAIAGATLVLGTGTLTHRRPEQPVISLPALAPMVAEELGRNGRIALVFGPEKHGLTREDLSYCHALVEIPTDPQQPSMNLGQAAAVCLYELASRTFSDSAPTTPDVAPGNAIAPAAANLDLLAGLIDEVMVASNYSPVKMQAANRLAIRVLLRRLRLTSADTRRILGLFRRIHFRLRRASARGNVTNDRPEAT